MRFDTSQHMRLSQQMKLAPRMIQSMEILQMPLLQLEERIEQELEGNPTLDAVEAVVDGGADGAVDGEQVAQLKEQRREVEREARESERPLDVDSGSGTDDFERLESFEETHPDVWEPDRTAPAPSLDRRDEMLGSYSQSRMAGERDAKSDAMANTAARGASVTEQLLEQWRLTDVDEALRPLGELIVSYVEDDGYLRTPLETIIDRAPAELAGAAGSNGEAAADGAGPAATSKPSLGQMERALTAVQLLLDPPGVAARDVRECLLLQIDAIVGEGVGGERSAEWAAVRRLVAEHLDDLAQNRLPKISEKTGLPIEEVKKAVERMGVLSLAPGRRLAPETPGMIVPDAIVEFDEEQDRYVAYLNESRLPSLRVNQEYAKMARDREAPKPTREFLKKNISNAAWLIDAVEQRKRTLLRVINVVVTAQRDYFDYGPQSLRPLPMTQVAEQLGVHVATVSRAVAEKYLMTPRGVVPLRGFFTGGTQTESGEEVSWDAVKAALKEVIDAEDKKNPLSDEALAEEVKKRGIEIARRTVAKYRDQLGVPSARLRKTF